MDLLSQNHLLNQNVLGCFKWSKYYPEDPILQMEGVQQMLTSSTDKNRSR